MKKEIEKLNELALDYVQFGIGIGLMDTHNNLSDMYPYPEDLKKVKISLYFSDSGAKWSLTLGVVEIVGYSQKIVFPINYTEEDLSAVCEIGSKYLEHLYKDIAKIKRSALKAKAEKIQSLRKEIESLRTL